MFKIQKKSYLFVSVDGDRFCQSAYCLFLAKRRLIEKRPEFKIESIKRLSPKKRKNTRTEHENRLAEKFDRIVAGCIRDAVNQHGLSKMTLNSSAVKRISRTILGNKHLLDEIKRLK